MNRYLNLHHRWRKVKCRGGVIVFKSEVGYVRQQCREIWNLEREGPWVPVVTCKAGGAYTPSKMMGGYRRAVWAMRALERYLLDTRVSRARSRANQCKGTLKS